MSFRRASPAPQRLLRTRGVTQDRIKLWLARRADARAMLVELKLEQYIETFEEEEMTSIELLCDIGGRADGEKELTEALKEMGIQKMGHRQAIVGAVMGK